MLARGDRIMKPLSPTKDSMGLPLLNCPNCSMGRPSGRGTAFAGGAVVVYDVVPHAIIDVSHDESP